MHIWISLVPGARFRSAIATRDLAMLPTTSSDKRTAVHQHRRRKSSISLIQRRIWRTYSRKTVIAVSILFIIPICVFALLAFGFIPLASPFPFTNSDRHHSSDPNLSEDRLWPASHLNRTVNEKSARLQLALVFLPNISLLQAFSPTACRLKQTFVRLNIIVRAIQEPMDTFDFCHLTAEPFPPSSTTFEEQLATLALVNSSRPDVFLTCFEPGQATLPESFLRKTFEKTTVIQLPCEDLQHSEWMGTLQPTEWLSMQQAYLTWYCLTKLD